ncbi:nicotinamide N methyltransferase [Trichuris trichiura]|uniref:Nicotinamide N methyltransferase n=1 Tax=Trichuris trichiura TaxID=36087 RepID=A0A077ZEE9_TRITR|nr:nicotinamide N methyltransferase [Trichuris trichiura]
MQSTILLAPSDQLTYFEPLTYLKEYYGNNDMSHGLKTIISFLPNFAARLPHCSTFLDVGSGPTVYMAMGLRNKVDSIYLSDYAEQNREHLLLWRKGQAKFNWNPIAEAIATLEGNACEWQSVETVARSKVKAIIKCDVLAKPCLPAPYSDKRFDIVSTVFCLEYATTDLQLFRYGLKNVVSMIRNGGWLILGGAYQEHTYDLGRCRFLCLYLKEEELMESLRQAGIDIYSPTFFYYTFEDAYVILASIR